MMTSSNGNIFREFPAKRPVTRSFDVFFDLCLNKRLSKQSWGWWSETLSCSLWRHSNVIGIVGNAGSTYPCLLWGILYHPGRDHTLYGLGQWGKALHSNASFHWPSPHPERSLSRHVRNNSKYVFIFFPQINLERQELNITWWRHHIETFSALLVLCEGNPPVTG